MQLLKKDMKKEISFWLIPEETQKTHFQKLINKYAKIYDAPSFEPHMTIYKEALTEKDAIKAIRDVAQTSQRLEMKIGGVDYSNKIFKTLYLFFKNSKSAQVISQNLKTASSGTSNFRLAPHLSLLYKKMNEKEQKKLAKDLSLPFASVIFSEIVAVRTEVGIKIKKDVEDWQILSGVSL